MKIRRLLELLGKGGFGVALGIFYGAILLDINPKNDFYKNFFLIVLLFILIIINGKVVSEIDCSLNEERKDKNDK